MGSSDRLTVGSLEIAAPLYDLVRFEIAPGTGLDPDAVWVALGAIVAELVPENRRLLDVRARHEKSLDDWYPRPAGR